MNSVAKKILKVSESLHMWGQGTAHGELDVSKMSRRQSTGFIVPNENYFKWIAADKEIVKSVLLSRVQWRAPRRRSWSTSRRSRGSDPLHGRSSGRTLHS